MIFLHVVYLLWTADESANAGRLSAIMEATTSPEKNVRAAMEKIAVEALKASVNTPDINPPKA